MMDYEKQKSLINKYDLRKKHYSVNDSDRPIIVTGTSKAKVPERSERFLDHNVDSVIFPSKSADESGKPGYYHRLEFDHGVMVACTDDEYRLGLVEQFRHPIGEYTIELPSGRVDETALKIVVDDPEKVRSIIEEAKYQNKNILDLLGDDQIEAMIAEAARIETIEELGVVPNEMKRLFPNPLMASVGMANQPFHIFLAKKGESSKDNFDTDNDGEAGIRHIWPSVGEAVDMVQTGLVVEQATVASILALDRYIKEHKNIEI